MKKYTVQDSKSVSPKYDSIEDARREIERMIEWGADNVVIRVIETPDEFSLWTDDTTSVFIFVAGKYRLIKPGRLTSLPFGSSFGTNVDGFIPFNPKES